MNCWYPTEGPNTVGPAGTRSCQHPHCSNIDFLCENYSIIQGIYMPTFIHEIVERYVFKPPICFVFVTMGCKREDAKK